MIPTNSSSLTLSSCSIHCSFQRTNLSGRHRAWSTPMRTRRFLPGKLSWIPSREQAKFRICREFADRSYDAGTIGELRRPVCHTQTPKKCLNLVACHSPSSVQVHHNGIQAHRSLSMTSESFKRCVSSIHLSSHSLLPYRLIDSCPFWIWLAPFLVAAFRSKPIRLPSHLLLRTVLRRCSACNGFLQC